jgi:hypothetical protein
MHKIIMSFSLTGALALAGCGGSGSVADKAAEEIIEQQARQDGQEVDVELNSDGGTFTVKAKEDGTQINFGEQGATLPEGWPADVPVAEGIKISMSQSSTSDGQFIVTGSVGKPVADLVDFYKQALVENGWAEEEVTSMNMQGMNMSNLRYTKDSRTATANIVQQGDTTQLTLVVEGK